MSTAPGTARRGTALLGVLALVLAALGAMSATAPMARAAAAGGTVAAWGADFAGQTDVPVELVGRVTAISAGGGHSLALLTDSTVAAWGANDFGQTNVPVGLTGVTAIAAGGYHSLALLADGTVVAWGHSSYGQADVPVGLDQVIAISAGDLHSLVLRADGTVVGWGWNQDGQADVPAGLDQVTAIDAGSTHSLALRSDGTVVAWGGNSSGKLDVPAGLDSATAIAAGLGFSLALRADGTVLGWGDNSASQTDVPADLDDAVAVAAGGYFATALRSDGTVIAWGNGIAGGETDVPAGLGGVTAVSAGAVFGLALVGGYDWDRLAGPDRYATAVAVSQELFDPGVTAVTIAYGGNFPDALAAGPMAGMLGPLLLVYRDAVPGVVASELQRLAPEYIVIVGGEAVVSAAVEASLQAYVAPGNVVRYAGPNRYATAAEIAAGGWDSAETAFLATGETFPDALSAGPVAATIDAPLLLTPRASLHPATAAIMQQLQVKQVVVAGGEGAVSAAVVAQLESLGIVVERAAGPDRYGTSAALVDVAFEAAPVAFLATGANFPDALGGGVAAAYYGFPLLLTARDCQPPVIATSLQQLNPELVLVLGGPAVVSDAAAAGLVCAG